MNNTPLCDLVDNFLDHCQFFKSLSSNTLAAYYQDMAEFVVFSGAETSLKSLHAEDLKSYLRRLRAERKLSAATIRRRFACLKAFFRWAKEEHYIEVSPFDETSIVIRIPKRLPRTLSTPEIHDLARSMSKSRRVADNIRAVSTLTKIEVTTFLCTYLMLATGLRVSELLGMRLGDIDPSCSVIRVHGKGARERVVFITNNQLTTLFSDYIDVRKRLSVKDDLVFRNTRNAPLTPQALRLRLRKLGRALSFPQNLTPHRFRHTAATMLIEEGVDIRFVQRLLGHSSISTTEIYTHVADSSLRSILETTDHLGRVME